MEMKRNLMRKRNDKKKSQWEMYMSDYASARGTDIAVRECHNLGTVIVALFTLKI